MPAAATPINLASMAGMLVEDKLMAIDPSLQNGKKMKSLWVLIPSRIEGGPAQQVVRAQRAEANSSNQAIQPQATMGVFVAS